MRDDAYIGRCSKNNIICIVHDDLGWQNQQLDIFCRVTGFTSGFLSFIDVELIRFFHGALQLQYTQNHRVLFKKKYSLTLK